ncbi:unnamed protein product [Ixodes pacificus]
MSVHLRALGLGGQVVGRVLQVRGRVRHAGCQRLQRCRRVWHPHGVVVVGAPVDAVPIADKVLLVDAVAQRVWDAPHYCPPDLRGRHLAQLCAAGVAVPGRVRCADQEGGGSVPTLVPAWSSAWGLTCQGVVGLVLVHVQGGGPNATVLEGRREGSLVHQAASGCVHQEGAGPHLLHRVLVDQVVVVLVERAVQRHTVALKQQVLQRVHPAQPQGLLYAVRQVGVVEDDVEAKHPGSQSHRRAHAPCRAQLRPHDAQRVSPDAGTTLGRLAHLLGALELLALTHHVGQPVGAPVQVENQAECCVGHLLHAVTRHVAHGNACGTEHRAPSLTELPGCLRVNVVHPRPDAHNDAQGLELLKVLLGQGDGVPHESPHCLVQHLLVDLLGRLGVTEGHRRHVLEDRHLHRAVAPVQQRHQGPRVQGPIRYGAPGPQRRVVHARPLQGLLLVHRRQHTADSRLALYLESSRLRATHHF